MCVSEMICLRCIGQNVSPSLALVISLAIQIAIQQSKWFSFKKTSPRLSAAFEMCEFNHTKLQSVCFQRLLEASARGFALLTLGFHCVCLIERITTSITAKMVLSVKPDEWAYQQLQ